MQMHVDYSNQNHDTDFSNLEGKFDTVTEDVEKVKGQSQNFKKKE